MRDEVYIIGGGPSIKNIDLSKLKDKDTIVVNKAILDVLNPNYFITMDYTFLKKINNNNLINTDFVKVFIANFTYDYIQNVDGRIVDTRFNLVYDLSDFDIIIKSYFTNGFGIRFNQFCNGNNSGFCALQLAYLLGYKKIYLLGIDLVLDGDQTHYHGGYGNSKKFKQRLPDYISNFVDGIIELKMKDNSVKLYSCSDISILNEHIEYIKYDSAL